MNNKLYKIYLDNNLIGTSALEKADAPMGVVFGKITFINSNFGFDFWEEYCKNSKLQANIFSELRALTTPHIEWLSVYSIDEKEIKGIGGIYIEGMDTEGYEITILGIGYPFYEIEFPHHCKNYKDQCL